MRKRGPSSLGLAAMLVIQAATASAQDPRTMPPDSWLEIPDSRLRDVAPPSDFDAVRGAVGVAAVVAQAGGAALDTRRSRLVVWGGGSHGYYGNELYAFDVPTLSWIRLTDPSLAANPEGRPDTAHCGDPLPDGQPASRSTFGGLAYLAHVDRFFGLGGAGPCGGCGVPLPWTFDFTTSAWRTSPSVASGPLTGCGDVAVYDPATRLLYWGEGAFPSWGLWSYDVASGVWSHLAADVAGGDVITQQSGAIDTRRRQLVYLGNGLAAGIDVMGLFSYPLDTPSPVREVWEWRGTTVEAIARSPGPGFDYDPTRDVFVAWFGGAEADAPAHILDAETRTWSVSTAPGAPPGPMSLARVYGRWRYVPSVDAFILVTSVDANVFFYKPPGVVAPIDGGPPIDLDAGNDGGSPDAASALFDAGEDEKTLPHFRGSSLLGCSVEVRDRSARSGSGIALAIFFALSVGALARSRRTCHHHDLENRGEGRCLRRAPYGSTGYFVRRLGGSIGLSWIRTRWPSGFRRTASPGRSTTSIRRSAARTRCRSRT